MILLREAALADIKSMQALAKVASENHPGFLNIPSDLDLWKDKVKHSIDSFGAKLRNPLDAKYIFLAEDTAKRRIVGMSMISAQHGTEASPHFYFEVGQEKKYSETINTGFIHGTLKLKIDTNGPTEIGGLMVDPDWRGKEASVGKQISMVRFLYMGMHKNRFRKKILAELLPPLTKKGKSPLWEAIGRRFTNMEYFEADELSSKNKEFILSLFPSGKIYTTFLAADARNAIGKVSKDTEPAQYMLKKIGFRYLHQVDPFDGGPHLWADFDSVAPIRALKTFEYSGERGELSREGIATPVKSKKGFVAAHVVAGIQNQKIWFSSETARAIGVKAGDPISFMPYD